jgi:uncharacterized protein (DUF302 family)
VRPELTDRVSDREDFLEWFGTRWRAAEDALHEGDAGPRFETWSERAPVTLFGAWLTALDPASVRDAFQKLADGFSGARSAEIEMIAADVSGDLAYTVHREITSTVVDGTPRSYVLRVTQAYRREDGQWKVVHRHGDEDRQGGPSGMTVTDATGSVADTVRSLEEALDARGIRVFATIDHAAAARDAGLELRDEVVLVFGAPAVGTALMQSDARAGLDLPLRILVWDDAGRTRLGYHDPRRLAEDYDLRERRAVLDKLAGLLEALAASVAA